MRESWVVKITGLSRVVTELSCRCLPASEAETEARGRGGARCTLRLSPRILHLALFVCGAAHASLLGRS